MRGNSTRSMEKVSRQTLSPKKRAQALNGHIQLKPLPMLVVRYKYPEVQIRPFVTRPGEHNISETDGPGGLS